MSHNGGIDLIGDGSGTSFRPRLGRIRADDPKLFINRVNKAVARSRAATGRNKYSGTSGRFNARDRGSKIAPGLKRSYGWSNEMGMRFRARRVIVKVRVVKLKGSASRAAHAHLRYLMREGVSLDRSADDVSETAETVTVFIVPPDKGRYSGGHLKMSFYGDKMVAAEISLTLLP